MVLVAFSPKYKKLSLPQCSQNRLMNLIEAVAVHKNIKGVIVECGVWKGGAML